MIPSRFRPLTTGKASKAAINAAILLLLETWDYDPGVYTFIGTREGVRWRDHPIRWDREAKIAEILAAFPADRFDIYFCPNPFSRPQRRTALAMPTRYAWCDIDDADPAAYDPLPSIMWETSPDRFQGLWMWPTYSPGDVAEKISRNIFVKNGGDNGWTVTKMLRLPGTINHKSRYNSPVVTLRAYDGRPQKLPAFLSELELPSKRVKLGNLDIEGIDPAEVMRRYRRPMGLCAGSLMTATRVMRDDRSGAVFKIVMAMIEAGAKDAEIVAVLLVNPYFNSKWGTNLDRAKDTVVAGRNRAETSR